MRRPIVSSSTPLWCLLAGSGLSGGRLFKPLHPYQAYRRAWEQGQGSSDSASTCHIRQKPWMEIMTSFPSLCRQGVLEGKGEGREARGDGRKVSVPWTYSAVQNRTSPTPLSSEADELDEAQYHDRHTLPRSVSPAWVGHAGERRRNATGHLYGTGESTDDPYCSDQPVVGCTRTPIGQGQAQLRNDLIMKQRLCALDWWASRGEAARKALGGH
jgi:hypothetical protein